MSEAGVFERYGEAHETAEEHCDPGFSIVPAPQKKMLAFYVDETLTEAEEAEALRALASRGVGALEYRRIPFVFPAHGEAITNEKMLEVLKGHIRNAGVPVGVQSIFVGVIVLLVLNLAVWFEFLL